MTDRTVLVFGAGATKACGGPLTDEILPEAFKIRETFPGLEREGFLELVNEFLVDYHRIPVNIQDRSPEDYPQLPMLLAFLGTAIDSQESLGDSWDTGRLKIVRAGLDFLIFALLQHKLQSLDHNYYMDILEVVQGRGVDEPDVISLNYDIIVDNSLCRIAEQSARYGFPDYGTCISTQAYQRFERFGRLAKLHGSLHWIFCPGCQNLYLGMSESGTGFAKVLDELYQEDNLYERYSCQGSQCGNCNTPVRPVLITPTYEKDYQNPHIKAAWDLARTMLRDADRAIIVGYSLPHDDRHVTYLLRQGLNHVDPSRITVVDFDREFQLGRDDPKEHLHRNEVGRRYRTLFGSDLDWHPEGLGAWLASL